MKSGYVTRRGVFGRAIAQGQNVNSYWGPQYAPVPTTPNYRPVPQAFRMNPLDYAPISAGQVIRQTPSPTMAIGSIENAASASARNLMAMYGNELYGRGQGVFEGKTMGCQSSGQMDDPQRGGIFDASSLSEGCTYDGAMVGRPLPIVAQKMRRLVNEDNYSKPIGFRRAVGSDGLWGR